MPQGFVTFGCRHLLDEAVQDSNSITTSFKLRLSEAKKLVLNDLKTKTWITF